MPKNSFQDMVKTKNKKPTGDIKNIIIKKTPVKEIVKEKSKEELEDEFFTRKRPQYIKTPSNNQSKIWLVASVCVIFLLFTLSYFFSKVTVTLNPKIQDIDLKQNIVANKDGLNNALPFDIIVISGEEEKTVETTDEKDVLQKAEGSVILYNNFSTALQKLNIDTRLEGSNGKMYMTKTAVSIPGMSKVGKPGSVSVKIYAKEGGEAYNSEPLDFKIFGFKNTAKYAKFYGRSTGDITGGLNGKFPVITQEQQDALAGDLKDSLQVKLLKKAGDQIPNNFTLFKDAVFLDTNNANVEITSPKSKTLTLKLKGTLYGILFNTDKITKEIAQANIDGYDGAQVYVSNIKDLVFSLNNKDNISWADIKDVSFVLSGKTKLVWSVDENKILNDLIGTPKKEFNSILLNYPNIESADLVVSPIWRMSLPDKRQDIKLIINYPK